MVSSVVLRISLLLVISTVCYDAAPVSSETQAMMYLARFGYLDPAVQNPSSAALVSGETVKRAILDFQAFAGINQTGVMDSETSKWMSMPRCGVVDRVGPGASARRKKRYALQGSRWRVKELTYSITKYPSKLKSSDVDRELSKAFQVWSDVTELTFVQLRSGAKVHIEIRFEEGEHGDGDPFDGRGGTLAHAYFPIYGGDAHFDEAETWTINSYKGTNLFQVAAHEFGHSLGLSHSDVRAALMAPFYRGYEPNFALDYDDITAIQQLYGKSKKTVTTEQPKTIRPKGSINPPGGSSYNELCSDGKFDTIFTASDSKTYVLKGDKYWKLSDDGNSISSGYPRYIKSMWDGLPASVDAAFTWSNGKTYFFKGSKYWRYTNFKLDSGYPKELSEGFAGVPDNIDTALVWSGNGKIYFFKGSKYWRFDPSQSPPIKSSYPKDISNWEGIPNNLDAAFQFTNGYSYFFKSGQYWRFNDRSFKVDEMVPPYPRSTSTWWFGCADVKGSRPSAGLNTHERPHADDEDADLLDAGYDDEKPDNDVIDDAVSFVEPSHRRKDVATAGFQGASSSSGGASGSSFTLLAAAVVLVTLLVQQQQQQ